MRHFLILYFIFITNGTSKEDHIITFDTTLNLLIASFLYKLEIIWNSLYEAPFIPK